MLLRDMVQKHPLCSHRVHFPTLSTHCLDEHIPVPNTAELSPQPCRLHNCHLSPSGHRQGMMLPGCFGREGLRAVISLTAWPRTPGLGWKSFTPDCAASLKSQRCPIFCDLWRGLSCSSVSCQGHQA